MSESILSLQGITKSFGGTPVLNGIDLEAAQGEFITLLGSSGCGKTTTLRIIAGLEDPDQGRVLLEGQDMTHTEPNKRDVNTVFQNYALFPHMSVEQNIGYALKIRKRPKAEIREEVKKMLELVQLEGVNPAIAKRLRKEGVTTLRQLREEVPIEEAMSACRVESSIAAKVGVLEGSWLLGCGRRAERKYEVAWKNDVRVVLSLNGWVI